VDKGWRNTRKEHGTGSGGMEANNAGPGFWPEQPRLGGTRQGAGTTT
jgi:hypothetical protein